MATELVLQIGLESFPTILNPAARRPESPGERMHRVNGNLHKIEDRPHCLTCDRELGGSDTVVRIGDGKVVLTREEIITEMHFAGLGTIEIPPDLPDELCYDHYYVDPNPEADPRDAERLYLLRDILKKRQRLFVVRICLRAKTPSRRGLLEPTSDGFKLHRLRFDDEFRPANLTAWNGLFTRTAADLRQLRRERRRLADTLEPYELDQLPALIAHPIREEERRQVEAAVMAQLKKMEKTKSK